MRDPGLEANGPIALMASDPRSYSTAQMKGVVKGGGPQWTPG